MKIIFSLLFILSFGFNKSTYGQDTLNRFDKEGKKDGKWIIYLNSNWEKTTDTAEAVYCRYTYFDHGVNIYPMGPCGGKNWKLETSLYNNKQTGKIKLLDGEYKWFDPKGRISSIHVLKNGEYISCKEFYSSGKLKQYFDYTKNWKGEPHTWYVSVYDEDGNFKYDSYMRKINGQWPRTRD